jgi:putative transposase
MNYNPDKHHRKSIRLKGYDYSQAGQYYVTICLQQRDCLFGKIGNGELKLNDAGKIIKNWWNKLPQKFTNIELYDFIIMPNHFHGIITVGAGSEPAPTAPIKTSLI